MCVRVTSYQLLLMIRCSAVKMRSLSCGKIQASYLVPRYLLGEDWEERGCALDWQVGDISVICDNGASCNMSYPYSGVINYREAKTFMKTASGTRYPI